MNPIKVISMIVTVILFLCGILLCGWSLFLGPHWGMLVCCVALTVMIGYFVYADVLYLKKYFTEKSNK